MTELELGALRFPPTGRAASLFEQESELIDETQGGARRFRNRVLLAASKP